MEMFLIFSWEIKIIRQLNFRSPLIQKASSVLKSNGEEPHKVFKVRIFPFSGGPEGCWPTIDRVSRQIITITGKPLSDFARPHHVIYWGNLRQGVNGGWDAWKWILRLHCCWLIAGVLNHHLCSITVIHSGHGLFYSFPKPSVFWCSKCKH